MSALLPVAAKSLLAYADGSCIGNPGPGGWGAVICKPDGAREELSGGEPATTNNRMELTAAIETLRAIARGASVVLRSDSQYVVKGINENRKRKANGDLWDQLDAEIAERRVTFEWVRGHADDPLNRRADEARACAGRTNRARRRACGGQVRPAGKDQSRRRLGGAAPAAHRGRNRPRMRRMWPAVRREARALLLARRVSAQGPPRAEGGLNPRGPGPIDRRWQNRRLDSVPGGTHRS